MGHIRSCLESLAAQTLDADQFEVVVVLNGEPDGTRQVLLEVREEHPDLDLRMLQVQQAGAGRARNVGLEVARGDHVTFVDDDDSVGPDFLRAMRAAAGPSVIVAAPVHEVRSPDRADEPPSYIARRLRQVAGSTRSLAEAAVVCEYNAAKLISAASARSARYDTSLRSGEDFLYWMRVVAAGRHDVRILADRPDVAYVRTVRDVGVGRQGPSFDFRVTQRLECMAALRRVDHDDPQVAEVNENLVRAQAQWINGYLREHPDERPRVEAEAARHAVEDLPWDVVNAGLADQVALLYCFPPDLDTSGIVAAKRLGAAGEVTDVVSADLSSLRDTDARAARLVGPALGRRHVVPGAPTFHLWEPVRQWAEEARECVRRWEADHPAGGYQRLYSRAMAVGSHYGAALVKLDHPGIAWTAEFSDPLRFNPVGEERVGDVAVTDDVAQELLEALAAAGARVPEQPRLFDLAERLAYALADRVVFTNEHQRDYMLGYCDDARLVRRVRERSEVSPHPVPPASAYTVGRSPVHLSSDRVHLAYFGVFYATRDLSVLLDALARLTREERSRVLLHVFTPQPRRLGEQVIARGLADVVRARPYVSYFDFLALTREVDLLVVNDADTSAHHRVNPYLPSKVADYVGSGTPTWAIYEPGSVLSTLPVAYRSPLGDVEAATRVMRELLAGSGVTGGRSRESRESSAFLA